MLGFGDPSLTLPCTFLTWSLGLSVFFALNFIHKLSLRLLPLLFTLLQPSHLPGTPYFPSVLLIFLPQQKFLLFNLLHFSTLIFIIYIYVSILKWGWDCHMFCLLLFLHPQLSGRQLLTTGSNSSFLPYSRKELFTRQVVGNHWDGAEWMNIYIHRNLRTGMLSIECFFFIMLKQ